MYYTVDRIEGDYAVIEAKNMALKNVALSGLPENIKEGDILRLENNIYIVDAERTEQMKKELEARLKKMFLN